MKSIKLFLILIMVVALAGLVNTGCSPRTNSGIPCPKINPEQMTLGPGSGMPQKAKVKRDKHGRIKK